jgi:hypothetical protein
MSAYQTCQPECFGRLDRTVAVMLGVQLLPTDANSHSDGKAPAAAPVTIA